MSNNIRPCLPTLYNLFFQTPPVYKNSLRPTLNNTNLVQSNSHYYTISLNRDDYLLRVYYFLQKIFVQRMQFHYQTSVLLVSPWLIA